MERDANAPLPLSFFVDRPVFRLSIQEPYAHCECLFVSWFLAAPPASILARLSSNVSGRRCFILRQAAVSLPNISFMNLMALFSVKDLLQGGSSQMTLYWIKMNWRHRSGEAHKIYLCISVCFENNLYRNPRRAPFPL